jgi:glycosyltransferase involved in cell wall biosynthesis
LKVLFLTPQPPFPADQGAKLRNAALIRIAAEAGHQVDLLTFTPQGGRGRAEGGGGDGGASPPGLPSPFRPPPSALERWCRRVVAVPAPRSRRLPARTLDAVRSGLPDLLLRLWSPLFLAKLRRMLEEERYDVVQAEGLELAPYLRAVQTASTVLDEHNVEYLLQQRAWRSDLGSARRAHAVLYSFLQWRKLRRWEKRLCLEASAVLAVSDEEAAALSSLIRRAVASVPNGIDLATVPFREPSGDCNPNLLFDGTMSFRPNHDAASWFAHDILPLVRARQARARFWVVGRDPPRDLVACNFRPMGVAVTGEVASVEPYWQRAGLYVLPMRMGAGVRFKALYAMARGIPIVSTKLGMAGTPAGPGRDYLQAERPTEFAAATLQLLEDPSLRRALAENARQAVRVHDWSQLAPRLLKVYEGLNAGDGSKSC